MKKLIVLVVLLALVPVLAPAKVDALTLRQRVTRLEGKLNCLRRVPVIQYNDFAEYGDPLDGLNATNTYDTSSPTGASNDNPDSLTDLGATTGLDWGFAVTGSPAPPPDYFVLAIRADAKRPLSGLRCEVRATDEAVLVATLGTLDAPATAGPRAVAPNSRRPASAGLFRF
jgi:hypothetical protein